MPGKTQKNGRTWKPEEDQEESKDPKSDGNAGQACVHCRFPQWQLLPQIRCSQLPECSHTAANHSGTKFWGYDMVNAVKDGPNHPAKSKANLGASLLTNYDTHMIII